MKWAPRGFGGERRPPEHIKREGWQAQRLLVIEVDDERLTWPERELVRQLGDKLGLSRATAHEHWIYAHCLIAWRLNGRQHGSDVSRRQMISDRRAANR